MNHFLIDKNRIQPITPQGDAYIKEHGADLVNYFRRECPDMVYNPLTGDISFKRVKDAVSIAKLMLALVANPEYSTRATLEILKGIAED